MNKNYKINKKKDNLLKNLCIKKKMSKKNLTKKKEINTTMNKSF